MDVSKAIGSVNFCWVLQVFHCCKDHMHTTTTTLWATNAVFHPTRCCRPTFELYCTGVEFDDPARGKHDGAVEKPDVSVQSARGHSSIAGERWQFPPLPEDLRLPHLFLSWAQRRRSLSNLLQKRCKIRFSVEHRVGYLVKSTLVFCGYAKKNRTSQKQVFAW